MADTDRVMCPEEVGDAKAAAAEVKPENGDSNSVEEPAPETPKVTMRNMISVPPNCPPGYQMGVDGVCREVFD